MGCDSCSSSDSSSIQYIKCKKKCDSSSSSSSCSSSSSSSSEWFDCSSSSSSSSECYQLKCKKKKKCKGFKLDKVFNDKCSNRGYKDRCQCLSKYINNKCYNYKYFEKDCKCAKQKKKCNKGGKRDKHYGYDVNYFGQGGNYGYSYPGAAHYSYNTSVTPQYALGSGCKSCNN